MIAIVTSVVIYLFTAILAGGPVDRHIGSGLGVDREARKEYVITRVIHKKTVRSGIGRNGH